VHAESFHVANPGYHTLDLSERVEPIAGQELVVAAGFAAQEDAEGEPLTYVLDTDCSSRLSTYRAVVDETGAIVAWKPFGSSSQPRVFHLQAIMADGGS
jgi:hypothetical protein